MIFENERSIDAPAEVVWKLTADVERWPSTTPTMTSVELLGDAPIGVGSAARVKQPGQRPTIWTVTRFEPSELFEWQAKVFGVQTVGRHRIVPEGLSCRNVLQVEMTGRGSTLLGKLLGRSIRKSIATENEGFKRAAEAS